MRGIITIAWLAACELRVTVLGLYGRSSGVLSFDSLHRILVMPVGRQIRSKISNHSVL
jgi:hypothetical protein